MAVNRKIRVLIVDDSAVVRQTMDKILSSDPIIEVVGHAQDPFVAAARIKNLIPDVITLDVEMPRMDGITFLQKIMSQHPIPVVMCSTVTTKGSEAALRALEYGAVEIITKPKLGTKEFLEESRIRICDAVKAAAQVNVTKLTTRHRSATTQSPQAVRVAPKLTADAVLPPLSSSTRILAQTTEKIVMVGASTGGTEALRIFLEALPANSPPIVIVQHMPEAFTKPFANRLDSLCQIRVKEAEDNDLVERGLALIAHGGRHTLLKRTGSRYFVEVKEGPLVSRHRPSVDVLFRSAARYGGKNCVGVIMTGMGDDGARGMKEMKDAGATNIAQDEKSCVVFGMPKEAIKHGGVDKILPLIQIAPEVLKLCAK
ncbi:MAG: chemotaxis response regulator protein-glutamate methylesterase [Magnetococcales bacterium]|nr:chemotaxis response regulator protein-glutamate methylesterase [Magnetococcales bacterium]